MKKFCCLALAALISIWLGGTAQAQDTMVMTKDAWLRATPPGAKTGAGYVTLRTTAKAGDRLVSVASPAARRVEIHTMTMKNNIMRMRRVEGGVALKPNVAVALKPGGRHLMFMGLKAPFKPGQHVPVTLRFERGGNVTVQFMVMKKMPARGHGPAMKMK